MLVRRCMYVCVCVGLFVCVCVVIVWVCTRFVGNFKALHLD